MMVTHADDDAHADWELRVVERPDAEAAHWLAQRVRDAVAERGTAAIAVSGGATAPPLFEALASHDLPWEQLSVWQVDERVVPDGDPERNAEQLEVLPTSLHAVHRMPVTDDDLDGAARRYAAGLPERFDVVHLGLGDDGHTASWPPGDGAVVSSRRPVEAIGEFNGHRRMTLTPDVVNHARARLMLTVGASKADMVARWLSGDRSIPVSHVRRSGTVVFVDPPAAPWQRGDGSAG